MVGGSLGCTMSYAILEQRNGCRSVEQRAIDVSQTAAPCALQVEHYKAAALATRAFAHEHGDKAPASPSPPAASFTMGDPPGSNEAIAMTSSDSPIPWRAAFDDLAGLRALVTGASSGIGAALAQAFAECGVHVCMHYGHRAHEAAAAAEALRARGLSATTVGADLSVPGAASAMVTSAAASLGGLDLLVNVAGAPLGRAGVETLDDDVCAAILELNLRAVIEAIRAAIPHLRRAAHPAIINTSSVSVRTGGGRGVAVYAAAKSGVESLTRSLSRELAPDGIRVNCVAPGYIETAIHDGFSTEHDRRSYIAATPLARGGTADECVGAYLFLACHRLSSFVTGQTIAVNGGLSVG